MTMSRKQSAPFCSVVLWGFPSDALHEVSEHDSTLYVGMIQGVSKSQYIGIGTKSRKAPKTAKTKLSRVKYQLFLN